MVVHLPRALRHLLACGLLSLPLASAHAATTPSPPVAADPASRLLAAQAAVVGIEVQAADGARSAETLGRNRDGSGVVIGADGLILTIGYLLLEADSVSVITQDKRSLPARVVAYDLATGFGLVRPLVPLRGGVRPVELGDSADLQSGEQLLAATGGDDAGVAITRLVGRRPFSGYWEYHIDAALFTSPPISGHSGAALFNRRGELVGIGSLFTVDASGEGRRLPGNMYVPTELLRPVLAELQSQGLSRQSVRPWLGLNSTEQGGRVQIVRVSKDSPAEAAGLAPGDVVLAVDDTPVTTLEQFYKRLWAREQPDAQVRLTIRKAGVDSTVTLRAVDRMRTLRKPAGI